MRQIPQLSRAVIILSLGFQATSAAFAAEKPADVLADGVAPSLQLLTSRFKAIYEAGNPAGIKKSGIDFTNSVSSDTTTMVINTGVGGMTLSSASSLSNMKPTGTTTLVIGAADQAKDWSGLLGNYPPTVLNSSLTIKQALTAPSGITSTVLNPGGVIRINTTALTAAQLAMITATPISATSGFTTAFGIPAPIWGPAGGGSEGPWIIIAPTLAPTYAFRQSIIPHKLIDTVEAAFLTVGGLASLHNSFLGSPAGSTALVAAVKTASDSAIAFLTSAEAIPLGWADRLIPTTVGAGLISGIGGMKVASGKASATTSLDINSAIVMDPPALAALVAATARSNLSTVGATEASALGITNFQTNAGQWNIGVTSCGLPGFSVPGAHIQALLAATGGGQLVIAGTSTNGVTFS